MPRRRVSGEGTVTRRRDGRYEGRISLGTVDGKRLRKVVYGDSRPEVLGKIRELQVRYARKATNLRVNEHMKQWMRDNKSGWEAQTYRTYESWVGNHIFPYLGERVISTLDPASIRAWMRRLEDGGVGAPTRRRALSLFKSALKTLVREEQLDRNPCDAVDPPKAKRKPIFIPQPSEVIVLLETATLWLKTLMLVAFSCTMRQGEIFALHWSQVNLEAGSILVDRSLALGWTKKLERKVPKTAASLRTIFLPGITVRALELLRREQEEADYHGPWVFPDSEGGPLRKSNFIRRAWKPLFVSCNMNYFRFHATRHAGNSVLIAEGEDALSISRRMGQTDTRMTFDRYGHLFEGAARKTGASMERGLERFGINDKTIGLDNLTTEETSGS